MVAFEKMVFELVFTFRCVFGSWSFFLTAKCCLGLWFERVFVASATCNVKTWVWVSGSGFLCYYYVGTFGKFLLALVVFGCNFKKVHFSKKKCTLVHLGEPLMVCSPQERF